MNCDQSGSAGFYPKDEIGFRRAASEKINTLREESRMGQIFTSTVRILWTRGEEVK